MTAERPDTADGAVVDARPALPPLPARPALPPRPELPARLAPPARPALPPRPAAERTSAEARLAAPRKRPDPRPMRAVFGIGALTAMSVIGAGLVRPSWSVPDTASAQDVVDQTALAMPAKVKVKVNRVIRYVQLKPGQKAPPGARVINQADPTPRIVVTHVAAAAPDPPKQKRVVVKTRTRQSGRP